MKHLAIVLIILLAVNSLSAEFLTYDKVLRNLKGIRQYNNEQYEEANRSFTDNALNHPRDGRLHFNLGNSHYKKGNLEAAEQEFILALKDSNFPEQSKIYQNLGNISFQQRDYPKALENYRDALITNAGNEDARYNYELAKRFLQQQQQQQQDQSQDEQKQDEQKQDEQQQGEQQQQQKQDQSQQKQEQQKRQEQKVKEEEKKKEDAEQLLKALLQKEKEEMKKARQKIDAEKPSHGKYW